jgi:hypothetical protein
MIYQIDLAEVIFKLGSGSFHETARLLNTSLNFLDFVIEGSSILRDIESLSHERVTYSQDSLTDLRSILENDNIYSFTFELAIFCSLSPSLSHHWDIDIFKEGQCLAACGSE